MFESIRSMMQFCLLAVGLTALQSSSSTVVVVALMAVALVALSVRLITLASDAPQGPTRPAIEIDVSSPLTQSDPDAAGHIRSRAPGIVALAT
ncbi:hypothetical protein FHX49_000214 [Microbacterium endophyticum]|uniref:Uncharacterized protein n=1 Tax=Microbacterium endophyticum TaxID=1526412 RepID=A0A7W4V1Z8_9MICO|nr:DUF6412 domain-containing protein [Microbacterium endophyticum]MBB2974673.1 hypothetical protein [Microbacterium endophyticum]NIK36970.1 hypothetical protein [Microbacterium endophyticum]